MPTPLPYSNFRASAKQAGKGSLECVTEVYLPPWSTHAIGFFLLGMGVVLTQGSVLLGLVVVAVAVGTFRDAWTAKERGTYRFDGESGTVRWAARRGSQGSCPFSDIARFTTSFDWIGPLGRMRWLVAHCRDGRRFCIAGGSRRDLDAVRCTLARLGLEAARSERPPAP